MESIVYMSQAGNGSTFETIRLAMQRAHETGQTFRIMTNESRFGQYVKVKVGEGMWSAPLYGDPDPNQPSKREEDPYTLCCETFFAANGMEYTCNRNGSHDGLHTNTSGPDSAWVITEA